MSEFMNECVSDLLESAYEEGVKTALLQNGYEEKIATEYAAMMVKEAVGVPPKQLLRKAPKAKGTKEVKDAKGSKGKKKEEEGGVMDWLGKNKVPVGVGAGGLAAGALGGHLMTDKQGSLIADYVLTKVAVSAKLVGKAVDGAEAKAYKAVTGRPMHGGTSKNMLKNHDKKMKIREMLKERAPKTYGKRFENLVRGEKE
jgi:hypothetical protein